MFQDTEKYLRICNLFIFVLLFVSSSSPKICYRFRILPCKGWKLGNACQGIVGITSSGDAETREVPENVPAKRGCDGGNPVHSQVG